MKNITLLDCTLRDGGYVNNWRFGKENIEKIVQKIIQAGVEIVECGYLSTKDSGNTDAARFNSMQDVKRAYAFAKSIHQSYAVMVNFGEYPAELLENADKNSPIIRVAFHKKDLDKAFTYFYELKRKGFRFYVQPMGALNYTDEEYVQLIKRTSICVNYSSYLCGNDKIADDPTLMLINLLISAGVRSIAIAGFDGFSANSDENYFATGMSLGSNIASKLYKNNVIREQVAKIQEQIELNFITPSLYLE